METKEAIIRLIEALGKQNFTFSEKLHSGVDDDWGYLEGASKGFVNAIKKYTYLIDGDYSNIDKQKFDADFAKFQQSVSDDMLFAWKYSAGSLVMVGIMYADNLNIQDIKSLFKRLDDGTTNIMRTHVGRNAINGEKASNYATMMLVFANKEKAEMFNTLIRDFYSSHFWKQTYVSTISVDFSSEVITQGKGTLGTKWNGDIDLKMVRKHLFGA